MSKKKGIIGSTLQLTVAVLFIKVLGLAKKSIIAAVCGATAETDAFFIASEVIAALCTVFFSSISISLLSMHTNRLLKEGRDASNNLINAVLKIFIPIAFVITIIFVSFSDEISRILAPSYEGAQLQDLSSYIRIIAIVFVLVAITRSLMLYLKRIKDFFLEKVKPSFKIYLLLFLHCCFILRWESLHCYGPLFWLDLFNAYK